MAATTNALMKEDLAISKNTIIELEEEKLTAESQRDTILHVHKHQIEVCPKCGSSLQTNNNNAKTSPTKSPKITKSSPTKSPQKSPTSSSSSSTS